MSTKKSLELTIYPIGPGIYKDMLRPAKRNRQWLLDTRSSYALRCLPLTIANASGWEAINGGGFDAIWNGRTGPGDIEVIPHGDGPVVAQSHFGEGVLTFMIGALFKTPDEHNLTVQGPINLIKDGIQALTGIIETDWSPYTFTMNWKFTRPGRIRFEKGEAYCHFAPTPRRYIESFQPVIRDFETDDPALYANFMSWRKSRVEFIQKLYDLDEVTLNEGWQKLYYRGLSPDGMHKEARHQKRILPAQIVDESSFDYSNAGLGYGQRRLPLSACLTTLNDGASLGRYLDAVAPHVTEIVIVDLGSCDETLGIIEESAFTNLRLIQQTPDEITGSLSAHAAGFAKESHILQLQVEDRVGPAFWKELETALPGLDAVDAAYQSPVGITVLKEEPLLAILVDMYNGGTQGVLNTGTLRLVVCGTEAATGGQKTPPDTITSSQQPVISVFVEGHKATHPEYAVRKILGAAKLSGVAADQARLAPLLELLSDEQITEIHQDTQATAHPLPQDFWWGQQLLADDE